MAKSFKVEEWDKIYSQLDGNDHLYDLPAKSSNSIVFGSWNIRHFGEFWDGDTPKRSAGSTKLIVKFCERCDLIALQEVKASLSSVRNLLNTLNQNTTRDYKLLSSDITGRVPGKKKKGMKERSTFIYDSAKITLGEVISDLNIDQTEIIANVNKAIKATHANFARTNAIAKTKGWVSGKWLATSLLVRGRLKKFITLIRSPYLITIKVHGNDGASYDLSIVNTHLQYGTEKEREREFFYLLEWLVHSTNNPTDMEPPLTILMADLNLTFGKSNSKRRDAIAKTVSDYNSKMNSNRQLRVNFPFLDEHPTKGIIKTNARLSETFDHISTFSRGENRFPWARYNNTAGQHGVEGFDYGVFNFVKLFQDAGFARETDGKIDVSKFDFDVSDHMPIYLRMPIPDASQPTYSEDGIS